MKNLKRLLAGVLAISCIFGTVGCSKDEGSGDSTSDDFVPTENIAVDMADAADIEAIPEGAESNIKWLSYFDINPAKGSAEKRTDLSLFEEKGGTIEYIRTTSLKKYDDLATKVLSDNVPDMFWYEQNMTFPCNVVQGMFQPVDDIVDFDSALWSDVKEAAEDYTINGKHYVAPVKFEIQSVLTYDTQVIEANGLEDPYQLYLEGKWDWNTFEELMQEWVALGDEENIHYGVNGWLHAHIFHSTGKSLVEYDETTQQYVSNVNDADLERAANFLYDLTKDNLYYGDWIGQASDCFKKNILFYAMGTWASSDTHTPADGESWMCVPIPKDPNSDVYYQSSTPNAYMWVKGSTKSEAMKCWMECAKIVNTQESYIQTNKAKFMENNPNWSETAYDLVNIELLSDKFTQVFDAGYGISTDLSNNDAASNPTKEAIIAYMYSSVSKSDEETGNQYTWTQLRNTYSSKIQSELDKFNQEYKAFLEADSNS